MNKILKEILKNTKLQRNILIGLLVITVILFSRNCSNFNNIKENLNQNIHALTDTIRQYETENGNLIFQKAAFISENNNLKLLNRTLSNEIKDLKDNPLVVIKTRTVIKRDTIYVPINTIGDGYWDNGTFTQKFDWNINDDFGKGNYRKLGGKFSASVDSSYSITTSDMKITTDEIGISLTTGLTENSDGLLEIFVRSDYPGFKPTKIDGALVNPQESDILKRQFPEKRWGVGVYGGYGLYGDVVNSRFGHGLQIGIGVSYNIIKF